MIVYNVTFSVEKSVYQRWMKWLKQSFIPESLNSDYFNGVEILKIHADLDDLSDSYCVQFTSLSIKDVQLFEIEMMPVFKQGMLEYFGSRCIPFTTVLEKITV